jgi:hypothetical protein
VFDDKVVPPECQETRQFLTELAEQTDLEVEVDLVIPEGVRKHIVKCQKCQKDTVTMRKIRMENTIEYYIEKRKNAKNPT